MTEKISLTSFIKGFLYDTKQLNNPAKGKFVLNLNKFFYVFCLDCFAYLNF